MFRAILLTQWKWTRLPLLFGALLAFWIPLLSVQRATLAFGSRYELMYHTRDVLTWVEGWSVAYPLLAAALALLVSAIGWAPDHQGKHVYALSLPVARWHYTLLRFGAGAVLLAAPVIALSAGALLATSVATIPPGTHPHVWALTIRFGLAIAVAYALLFALASGSNRMARYILSVLGGVVVLHILLMVAANVDLLQYLAQWVLLWPGPLQIFTGRWMLIDV